ncbi:MAG: hypothetical protein WBE26_03540 [Phycisphaerae bacterium]
MTELLTTPNVGERVSRFAIPAWSILQVFTVQELIDELRRRKVIRGNFGQFLHKDWDKGPRYEEKLT